MSGPLDDLLRGPALENTLYPPGSRYHLVPIAQITLPDGRTVRYLRRRQLPDPAALVTVAQYRVASGDRLDTIAWQQLGDPLAAWRIADANVTLRMEELTEEPGRRLRITMAGTTQGGSGA
jgi:hypothetical protein